MRLFSRFYPSLVTLATVAAIAATPVLAGEKYGNWKKNPERLPAPANSDSGDGCNYISADGLALYFATTRTGGLGGNDIWVATRASTSTPFTVVAPLNINTSSQEQCPAVTNDNKLLYFVSNRSGGSGALDLYVSQGDGISRTTWGTPVNMGSVVNSGGAEEGPAIYQDAYGTTHVYFSSDRTGSGVPGGFNIYSMTVDGVSGQALSGPTLVGGVNTESNDRRPTIRHDGLEIIVETNRPGSAYGGHNLWSGTRASTSVDFGGFVAEDRINSDQNEARPSLNSDGRTLYFTSDRTGSAANDIYVTTREYEDEQ